MSKTIAKPLLAECEYPWHVLSKIKDFIIKIGHDLPVDEYECCGKNIWISKDVKLPNNATVFGPTIIGHSTEIRTGAFIRGSVIIGNECVIGNSCEIKNSIIFDCVQIPHFNYIGDSILGYHSHTGAGVITSNLKSDKSLVKVYCDNKIIDTGLKKFGAMIGDYVEVGCNSVLNPGTIIGKNTSIYPLSSVRGTVPSNSIFKSEDNIVKKL